MLSGPGELEAIRPSVTTGGSSREVVKLAQSRGAEVLAVLSIASRGAEEPDFGAEQLRNDEDAGDLTTRLAGPFTGWDGDTVFRLENGQLWQQIDSSYLYSRAESPRVTIRRAAFGSYLLQVEGIGRTVRVRRLE